MACARLLLAATSSLVSSRTVAIVTGGTRGIGRGIAETLAASGRDLFLTYNSDVSAARRSAKELGDSHGCVVHLFEGDLARPQTRRNLFRRFDEIYGSTHRLEVMVHNAGQYVGVTSTNGDGLNAASNGRFGDDSLLAADGTPNLTVMKYYQRLYGDAYVDLCARCVARMGPEGGSLVGISSPGCTLQYNPNPGYDLPGSGKCVMEYASRYFALRCSARNINCNVVIPGVTDTDAWGHLARRQGTSKQVLMKRMATSVAPMGCMTPVQVGAAVGFLCSSAGRWITGISLPVDGGVHLRT